ncbi:MAG: 4-hydroxy-tetrahydrodipicolinate reductase [Acidimicrobiia bacterium]|nr:4-hydroxy-tetrahydrodipicolinate reductase [Acidimicrobiia bacterium]
MTAPLVAVGVVGAGGKVGRAVCAAIAADPELHLVAAVDPHHAGSEAPGDVRISSELAALVDAQATVVVDFTVAPAARATLPWLAERGLHAVVGTTGLDDADLDGLRAAFTTSSCLVAPNFAIGAVLLMRFAELAAPWFDTAEIVEIHHDTKRDAPSGTALTTARRMAAASDRWAPDPTEDLVAEGARGARVAGIPVHAVRMRGAVANQEVILGTAGQTLTLRHDTTDRSCFTPGVLLAVKRAASLPAGLTVGLDTLLDL